MGLTVSSIVIATVILSKTHVPGTVYNVLAVHCDLSSDPSSQGNKTKQNKTCHAFVTVVLGSVMCVEPGGSLERIGQPG